MPSWQWGALPSPVSLAARLALLAQGACFGNSEVRLGISAEQCLAVGLHSEVSSFGLRALEEAC